MSRAANGANPVKDLYDALGQRVGMQGPAALVPAGTQPCTHDEGRRLTYQ